MANYQFSSDLVDDILWRAGEPTDGTSDFENVALTYLNRAYQAICVGGTEIDPTIDEVWWWLRSTSPYALVLIPAIETGTISLTNGSTAGTLTSAPAASVAGYFLKLEGEEDLFRISAHTAATTGVTLDVAYTGTTGSGKTYKLIKLEYSIATTVRKIIGQIRVYRNDQQHIPIVDLSALERHFPLAQLTGGVPQLAAMVGENTVRFSHYPSEQIRVDFDYLQAASALTNSGSEEPLVPKDYRRTIADAALYFLFKDKQDDRAVEAASVAKAGLQAMAGDHRRRTVKTSGNQFGRIAPRQDQLRRTKGPLRTSSGLIIG